MQTYIDKRGVENDLSPVVEDINGGLFDSGEALDGLLDGGSAGGASHSGDGEKGLGLRSLHEFLLVR